MVRITRVKVLERYCLEVAFDDDVCGVVDLSELAGKGVFALWRDPHVFEQVRIGSSARLSGVTKLISAQTPCILK